MGDNTQHDNLLFSMLKECKTLPVFLDHIFGFLNRRTDFYYLATEPNPTIGLPPGYSEQILKHSFYKWKTSNNKMANSYEVPHIAQEITIKSETVEEKISKHGIQNELLNNFSASEYYNGAYYDNYCWSQTLLDIDIYIKIPENLPTKNLVVKIFPEKISVKLKNTNEIILEGNLCDKIKHDAIWSIDKSKLNIHLDKCKELWWNCLILTENKLDVSKLDCSRPYEELPEEAQAKIEELQWNQERKRLGLPTSNQLAVHSMLKQAWNAEGSPFSGPFDPSSVKF